MPDRILTSHAGSLPRPEELIALNGRRTAGELPDEDAYLGSLRAGVADVVARQRGIGIDLVNDGEYGHSMGIGVSLTIFDGQRIGSAVTASEQQKDH